MSKLTVLHISPAPPQLGGMEAYMGNLLDSSLVERHSIILLNISKPRLFIGGTYNIKTGYAGAFKRRLSITLTSYSYSLKFFLQFILKLSFRKIDVIHIHTASYTSFWEKCSYILIAKAARKRIVLHVHGALFQEFYEKSSLKIQSLIRRFLNKCNAVIVLSEFWRVFFNTLMPNSKIVVVKNGINMKPFAGEIQKSDPVRFLHLGEVSHRKGIHDLISAAAKLNENGFVFHIDIVGPGEIEEFRAFADEKNVMHVLSLHGPKRGDVKLDFFKKADCFILASYGEGLPIAILEALAAGLPVISTKVGGIPEVIENGVNGYLCQPGNIDQIYSAMAKIIEEKDTRKQMSSANYAYARENFDIELCAEKISKAYEQLC